MINNTINNISNKELTDIEIFKFKTPKPNVKQFKIYNVWDLDYLPENKYIVDKIIIENGLHLLYGEYSSYKSFIALDLALSIAYGDKFLKRFPTTKTNVAYICAEGVSGFKQRRDAYLKHRKLERIDVNLNFVGESVHLLDEENAKILYQQLKTVNTKVLIVDTLNRNFGNGDENSTKDMTAYINNLDTYFIKNGITVVLIHHEGKNAERKGRGSNSLPCSCDVILKISKINDDVKINIEKIKDDREFSFFVKKTDVPVTNFSSSLAFEYVEKQNIERKELIKSCLLVLDCIKSGTAYTADKIFAFINQDNIKHYDEEIAISKKQVEKVIQKLKQLNILSYNQVNKQNELVVGWELRWDEFVKQD